MDDTAKYLIHASLAADGIIERSDVVGAVFGQTEGLLGDELDLRDLQQSSRVGRIDAEVESESGHSFGRITIASSLDKVQTAILAASLETISRVGPCRASVEVTDIEDVREAKRREVVERAKELLAHSFDESVMTSAEILEEVRESVRVEDIAEYSGLPAGPRVTDSDAIVVVEGRADVLTLLKYGIKNAVAVEGTDVPDAVADLTQARTVTAFLDGDRGGELILRELAQVGDVDYVTFAPEGRSVEDLSRSEVVTALRGKVPYESLPADGDIRAAVSAVTEGSTHPRTGSRTTESAAPDTGDAAESTESVDVDGPRESEDSPAATVQTVTEPEVNGDRASASEAADSPEAAGPSADGELVSPEGPDSHTDDGGEPGTGRTESETDAGRTETETDAGRTEAASEAVSGPTTLREHVEAVIGEETGLVRLLDGDFETLSEGPTGDAFDLVRDAEAVPYAVVLDGELDQRVLDVAAQRGVDHVVARETGSFVKQPVDVRVRMATELVESR